MTARPVKPKTKAKPSRIEALAIKWAKAHERMVEIGAHVDGWTGYGSQAELDLSKAEDAERLALGRLRTACIRSLGRSTRGKGKRNG